MEDIQFLPTHAGLLTRLSRFLKSCAPYGITAPGYSIIYATTNVYRALGMVITRGALTSLPNQAIEGYLHRRNILLNVGNRRNRGFTTLYEDERHDYLRHIRHSSVTQGILYVLCSVLSLVATMLCIVRTLALQALAITVCAVALPIVPLFFLLCATVAIERYAVARVRATFNTSVHKTISDYIKENLSFGRNTNGTGTSQEQDHHGTFSQDLTKLSQDLNGKPSTLVSMVSGVLATLGKAITLAVCIPVFLLVAPISLMVSSSVLLLSLCSLSKSTISKNIATMGDYAINDFLPITAKLRDGMLAYGTVKEVDIPTCEFGSLSSLSSMYFEEEVDPLLTTTTPTSWSSRTKLSRDNTAGRTLSV